MVLLALAACGGGAQEESVRTPIVVGIGPVPEGLSGWTEGGRISVRASLGEEWRPDLIAHELGHAMGLQHSADDDCVMGPWMNPQRAPALCEAEVSWAQRSSDSWAILVEQESLLAATQAACLRWNEAAGRPMLDVQVPEPGPRE